MGRISCMIIPGFIHSILELSSIRMCMKSHLYTPVAKHAMMCSPRETFNPEATLDTRAQEWLVHSILAELDVDHDRRISFDEFIPWYAYAYGDYLSNLIPFNSACRQKISSSFKDFPVRALTVRHRRAARHTATPKTPPRHVAPH